MNLQKNIVLCNWQNYTFTTLDQSNIFIFGKIHYESKM